MERPHDEPMSQAEALAQAITRIVPNPLEQATIACSTEWVIPPLSALCDQRWREAFAATKFAEALAWLCYECPLKGLEPSTRGELKSFAENWIEDAITAYGSPTVKLDSLRSFQQASQQADGYRDETFDGLTADESEGGR